MPGYELMGEEELGAIKNIFSKNNGVLFAHGFEKRRNNNFEVRNLEQKAANYFGTKYCLAVSSGTAGLKIALQCCNPGIDDEIITQSFNFISDGEVILDYKCKPVITNIDESLNMDVKDLEDKITSRTKAVIVCDMLGNGSNIEKISEVCKKHKILLIDDACEMIGGKYKNKFYGTFGDIGVFSLDFGKNITSGEGGLIFTDNFEYYKIMKHYTDHGHVLNPNYPRGADDFGKPGFNFRMTEIQGAIAQVQIDKLDYILQENKKRYNLLQKNITNKKIKNILIYEDVTLSYDTFVFFVEDVILRKLIVNLVKELNLGIKNLPDALRWHCFYYWDHIIDKKEKEHIKKSKNILNKCIAIPILLEKTEEEYLKCSEKINDLIKDYEEKKYSLEIDYLTIIPSRKGSKGIINKNGIPVFEGKSLIELATNSVDDSRLSELTFFSSDSDDYIKLYKKESSNKDITGDYIRPSEISSDESQRKEFLKDAIDHISKNYNLKINNIIMCQVTSPFFTYKDLDECIITHKNSNKKTTLSVCESWNSPTDLLIENGHENYKFLQQKDNTNRQKEEKSYYINGCFYISNYDFAKKRLNENKDPFTDDEEIDVHFMEKKSGLDIDSEFELNLYNCLKYE
jgi:8-amino-3,8-dideoxy-alpha-D-manno-octulosonate transaminase